MRRLTLLALFATAAVAVTMAVPAMAAYDCPGTIHPVGGTAAGYEAGICAGIACSRICGLVVDPYCAAPAGSPAAAACAAVDAIEG